MKIALVRGAFLNPWEGQNFEPLLDKHQLVAFGAKKILAKPGKIPVRHLFSPTDLPNFPKKMPILNRVFTDAHYLFGLEKELRGFDIAHCAETYYYYTHQCLNAKKRGWVKKVVSTCWEVIPFNNEGIWGRKKFKRRAYREVDLFVTPTEKARQALIKEGCSPKKIKVVRMGIDLRKFKIKKNKIEKDREDSEIKILFVGRLVKEKGVWELLEVFRKLLADLAGSRNLKLVLVGNGIEKKRILVWIDCVSMYRYIEIKRVDYLQINEEYQRADIFVLPSKPGKYFQEQYGMALVEAMAAGLPIITTNCGAIPEVVGSAAVLVKPGSVKELYSALSFLIKSEKKRQELGLRARKRAEEQFDREITAKKLETLYLNLLSRSLP